MFAETLINARVNAQTAPGSIRCVSELQWVALSQIHPTACTLTELKDALKKDPWSIKVFSNPYNLSPKRLSKELESIGASSLFKVIIKKIPNNPENQTNSEEAHF
jgi:hypothetical protein